MVMSGYCLQALGQMPARLAIAAEKTTHFGRWEWADLSDATLLTQFGARRTGTATSRWRSMGALFQPLDVLPDQDEPSLPSALAPHLVEVSALVTAYQHFVSTRGPARRIPSDNVYEITFEPGALAHDEDLWIITDAVHSTARWFVRSGVHMYGQDTAGRVTMRIPLCSAFYVLALACYPDRMLRPYPILNPLPPLTQLEAIALGWRHEGHPIAANQDVGGLVADNPIARTLYDREQTCNALAFERWEQCALAMIGWTLHMTDFYPKSAARTLATLRRQLRGPDRAATDRDTLNRLACLEQLRGSFVTNLIDFHNDEDLDETDPHAFALWDAEVTGTMEYIIATINRALPPRSAATTHRRFLTALQQRCDFFLENHPRLVTPALRTFFDRIHAWPR